MEVCAGKVECNVSAKRMWRAAFEDGQNCLPKAVPQAISHISYDGGHGFTQGSVRTIHMLKSYAEHVAKEMNSESLVLLVKEELEEVDNTGFKMKGKFVDGGFLGILVKRYTQIVNVVEGATAGTCVVHWTIEYEALDEERKAHAVAAFKELVPRGYKAIEAYLLSHDDYKEM